MPGCVGQGSRLAPAGHAPVDQARIARQTDIGRQAQPLHDPGTKTLDQRVGTGDQLQGGGNALGAFQVQGDHLPVAVENINLGIEQIRAGSAARSGLALDAQHGRPQISQEHCAHGRRAQGGKFDYLDAMQRSHFFPPRW